MTQYNEKKELRRNISQNRPINVKVKLGRSKIHNLLHGRIKRFTESAWHDQTTLMNDILGCVHFLHFESQNKISWFVNNTKWQEINNIAVLLGKKEEIGTFWIIVRARPNCPYYSPLCYWVSFDLNIVFCLQDPN